VRRTIILTLFIGWFLLFTGASAHAGPDGLDCSDESLWRTEGFFYLYRYHVSPSSTHPNELLLESTIEAVPCSQDAVDHPQGIVDGDFKFEATLRKRDPDGSGWGSFLDRKEISFSYLFSPGKSSETFSVSLSLAPESHLIYELSLKLLQMDSLFGIPIIRRSFEAPTPIRFKTIPESNGYLIVHRKKP
jgi:hypothetical protein